MTEEQKKEKGDRKNVGKPGKEMEYYWRKGNGGEWSERKALDLEKEGSGTGG